MEKSVYSSYEKRKKEKESESMLHTEIKTGTETYEAANVRVVREALEALNSGDIGNVQEFISPQYFNHESQIDPVRSKLRGPEEFIDTVKNLRSAFADLHYEEQETIASLQYFPDSYIEYVIPFGVPEHLKAEADKWYTYYIELMQHKKIPDMEVYEMS